MDSIHVFLLVSLLSMHYESQVSDSQVSHSNAFFWSTFFMVWLHTNYARVLQQRSRIWWKFPRQCSFWVGIQQDAWQQDVEKRDQLYLFHYRMTHTRFHRFLALLTPYIPTAHTTNHVREPISPEKALCMFLHRLGHGFSTHLVAELYGMGESTVRKYCHLFVEILCKHLLSCFISTPEGDRLHQIMSEFQNLTLLPNVCGALDGTHIRLQSKPKAPHNAAQYRTYKQFYSILLQGICDSKKIFWNVCVNAPGGQHDAVHWRMSAIHRQMHHRQVLATPSITLENLTIQPFLLADAGYPISKLLCKPFKKTANTESKVAFDRHMAKGRVKIEKAFGILKCRWRILQDLSVEIERAPRYVVACCILHNFLQLHADPEPEDAVDPHILQHRTFKMNGLRKRKANICGMSCFVSGASGLRLHKPSLVCLVWLGCVF